MLLKTQDFFFYCSSLSMQVGGLAQSMAVVPITFWSFRYHQVPAEPLTLGRTPIYGGGDEALCWLWNPFSQRFTVTQQGGFGH